MCQSWSAGSLHSGQCDTRARRQQYPNVDTNKAETEPLWETKKEPGSPPWVASQLALTRLITPNETKMGQVEEAPTSKSINLKQWSICREVVGNPLSLALGKPANCWTIYIILRVMRHPSVAPWQWKTKWKTSPTVSKQDGRHHGRREPETWGKVVSFKHGLLKMLLCYILTPFIKITNSQKSTNQYGGLLYWPSLHTSVIWCDLLWPSTH